MGVGGGDADWRRTMKTIIRGGGSGPSDSLTDGAAAELLRGEETQLRD